MITLTLPLPLSVNQLYRNRTEREKAITKALGRKQRGRSRTQEYNAWLNAAGSEVNAQLVGKRKALGLPLKGPLFARYTFNPDTKAADESNFVKAASDLLVKMNVIEDDRLFVEEHIVRGDAGNRQAVIELCRRDEVCVHVHFLEQADSESA